MEKLGDLTAKLIRQGSEKELLARSQTLPETLRPIEPKELAIKLVRTLEIWKLPDNWSEIGEFYREALADVPADLVDLALRHCRRNLKWFPKPCELREPIDRILKERHRAHAEFVQRRSDNERQLRERDEWLASFDAESAIR